MKRFIVAQVKIEINDETDYGQANMNTPANLVIYDHVTRHGTKVIIVQIDERK